MSIQSFTGRLTSSRRGAVLLGIGAAALAAVLLRCIHLAVPRQRQLDDGAAAGARREAAHRGGHARIGDRDEAALQDQHRLG